MTTATTNASTRPYHQNAARRNAKASATGKDARSANKLDKAIGLKIRIARLQKLDDGGRPMSQITLGKALGVTFQQVQKYEKGTGSWR